LASSIWCFGITQLDENGWQLAQTLADAGT